MERALEQVRKDTNELRHELDEQIQSIRHATTL